VNIDDISLVYDVSSGAGLIHAISHQQPDVINGGVVDTSIQIVFTTRFWLILNTESSLHDKFYLMFGTLDCLILSLGS
jgi:hypothetical protein